MKKLEHIGIAVKNLAEAEAIYNDILEVIPYKREEVASEGVKTSFYNTGETKLELLSATNKESAIQKFIDTRGEGIHHIAFKVDDIQSEIDRLISKGYQLVGEEVKDGADNKIIAFLHPKSSGGVLIELCQEKP